MCIASIAWNAHPRWRLVVAANRDEYHERPASALSRWDDGSGILAGRDLKGGCTWLGVGEQGTLVLITNFRVPGYPQPDRPSRGGLVTGLLTGDDPQSAEIAPFNPFNLILASGDKGLTFISNYPEEQRRRLPDGIHGLSNGHLAPPWPKTERLNAALSDWLASPSPSPADLFAPLRNETRRETGLDGPLPQLSGIFINDPVYGTRCSTVIAVDAEGQGTMTERSFDSNGAASGEASLTFRWPV